MRQLTMEMPLIGGKASKDYAQYRDIYPKQFYEKLAELSLGVKGQKVLDIGTGTGVIPRNMYAYGAEWTGGHMTRYTLETPSWCGDLFEPAHMITYDVPVTFTREGWHGRVKACRGIGASSLSQDEITSWEREHWEYMQTVPEVFDILHYVSILDVKKVGGK